MNTRSYAALLVLGITLPIACSLVNAPDAVQAGAGGTGGGGNEVSASSAKSSASVSGLTGPGGPLCGNGKLDKGETCDPPSSCPTTCPKNDACSTTKLTGEASACTAACVDTEITTCLAGMKDGCCPAACNGTNDLDCVHCGDGVVELGETCDDAIPDAGTPDGGGSEAGVDDGGVDAGDLGQHVACPATCPAPDVCTPVTLTGSAATCDAVCTTGAKIIECNNGDGCCPAGCTPATDNDCYCSQFVFAPGNTMVGGTPPAPFTCPSQATRWCDKSTPVSPTNATQAAEACAACFGVACMLVTGDCAGNGYSNVAEGGPTFGFTGAGCSNEPAGRIWVDGSSYSYYGTWAQ